MKTKTSEPEESNPEEEPFGCFFCLLILAGMLAAFAIVCRFTVSFGAETFGTNAP